MRLKLELGAFNNCRLFAQCGVRRRALYTVGKAGGELSFYWILGRPQGCACLAVLTVFQANQGRR